MEHTDVSRWSLADYKLGDVMDWASLVLLRVLRGTELIGYIFVIDRNFGPKAKYKLPGGHCKAGETPYDTASREIFGEAGITATNILLVDKWLHDHGNDRHWKCLFVADVSESRSMSLNTQNEENEGEEAEFFTIAEFHRLVRERKFLGNHYHELVHCKLIHTLPEASAA